MGQVHSLFKTAEKATSENIHISQGSETDHSTGYMTVSGKIQQEVSSATDCYSTDCYT